MGNTNLALLFLLEGKKINMGEFELYPFYSRKQTFVLQTVFEMLLPPPPCTGITLTRNTAQANHNMNTTLCVHVIPARVRLVKGIDDVSSTSLDVGDQVNSQVISDKNLITFSVS